MNEVRSIKYDNSWNYEELLKSRGDLDGEIVICPFTNENLFFIRQAGTKVSLTSYGQCYNCKRDVHFSVLRHHHDKQKPSYPVRYLGYWCNECYMLPEAAWNDEVKSITPLASVEEE